MTGVPYSLRCFTWWTAHALGHFVKFVYEGDCQVADSCMMTSHCVRIFAVHLYLRNILLSAVIDADIRIAL